MSEAKLVSILIPAYQGEAYLAETLDSAIAQTYPTLEVVLSDDGSTDDTLAIAHAYQAKCPFPFRIVHNPDRGMVNNWNHCIEQARGDYLKYLFQDDTITPDCIAEMVEVAEQRTDIGLVFSPRRLLMDDDADGNPQCRQIFDGCNNLHEYWSREAPVQSGLDYLERDDFLESPINKIGEPSTVLIRASVIEEVGGFDADLAQIVDFEMWSRIMAHCSIGFVDKELASFRIHPGQQSVKNLLSGESDKDVIRFCRKVLTHPGYAHLPRSFKERIYSILDKYMRHKEAACEDYRGQRDRGAERIRQLEQRERHLTASLRKTQDDFARVQQEWRRKEARRQETESELRRLRDESRRIQAELERQLAQAEGKVDEMQRSRVWKLRNALVALRTGASRIVPKAR